MAKKFLTLPIGYVRTDNEPLLNDQVFSSLAAAQEFANGITSYVGQVFSVITDNVAEVYVIKSFSGGVDGEPKVATLEKVGSEVITSYTKLTDKPAINGNELTATSTAAGLGLATIGNVATAKQEAIDAAASAVDTKLASYYTKTATDEAISNAVEALGNIFVVKGKLNSYDDLATVTEPKAGDVYLIPSTEAAGQVEEYVYTEDGTWERLGISVETDLTGYATEKYVDDEVDGLRQEVAGAGYLTEVPMASATELGGIKIGTGLQISEDGTVTVDGGSVANVEWAGVTNQPKINNNALVSGNNTNDSLGINSKSIHLDPSATTEFVVNLGAGNTLGMFKDGDKLDLTTTTIYDIVSKLLQKVVHPTYTAPSFSLSGGKTSGVEVGTIANVTLTGTFTKNDAGDVTNYVIKKGDETIFDPEDGKVANHTVSDFHYTDSAQTYSATVSYAAGAIKKNNLGEDDPTGAITASSITKTTTFTGQRGYFYKSMNTAVVNGANPYATPTTSAEVRALSTPTLMTKPSSGKTINITRTANSSNTFVFAFPSSWGKCTVNEKIGTVVNNLLGTDDYTTVSVDGATAGADSIDYKVYTFRTLALLDAGDWVIQFS